MGFIQPSARTAAACKGITGATLLGRLLLSPLLPVVGRPEPILPTDSVLLVIGWHSVRMGRVSVAPMAEMLEKEARDPNFRFAENAPSRQSYPTRKSPYRPLFLLTPQHESGSEPDSCCPVKKRSKGVAYRTSQSSSGRERLVLVLVDFRRCQVGSRSTVRSCSQRLALLAVHNPLGSANRVG